MKLIYHKLNNGYLKLFSFGNAPSIKKDSLISNIFQNEYPDKITS